MSSFELEQAEAAARIALGRQLATTRAFTEAGEDPAVFAALLARTMAEAASSGSDDVPIEQGLRLGLAVERLRDAGIDLESVLDLAVGVVMSVAVPVGDRAPSLGRALVVALARSYLDAESADQMEEQQRLRNLIGVSRAMNRSLDPDRVSETGLRETVRAMGVDAGAIWLCRTGSEHLLLAHTTGLAPAARESLAELDMMAWEEVAGAVRRELPTQFPIEIEDPHLGGYRTTLLIPLRGARDAIGLLAMLSRRLRTFDESEVAFAGAIGDHLAAALERAFEHRQEAHTDYLTGLANRSEFEAAVRRALASVRRHSRPLSLMLMDLDELKKINDTHGHHAGDEAIRTVARVIRTAVRTSDISARLGGDEFGVAMPEAGLAQAAEVAARIRQALEEGHLGSSAPIELSFGVAELQPDQEYEDLFVVADRNMYRDKRRHSTRRAAAAGRLGGSNPSSEPNSSPATRSK